MTDEEIAQDIETSFITFGRKRLGLPMYEWQCRAVEPFDEASWRMVQVSVCGPNGCGKDTYIIPTLVLGWLAMYPKGRVVCTTADARQLDGQTMKGIRAHQAKFPSWTFLEREIRTPTGGFFVGFTTTESGRAEGWHKLDDADGPLLIIANEAKTISDDIFEAIDRCTYNAILLCSSPGYMVGRFYESQFREELGYFRVAAGLKDCPHVAKEKIDRIIAQHGADSPFTLSTLEGKFMEAMGEARFNAAGLKKLKDEAENWTADRRRKMLIHIQESPWGVLQENAGAVTWLPTEERDGWVWRCEEPIQGCKYIGAGDPATGEQASGSKNRDSHAFCVVREAYSDVQGVFHRAAMVACLHAEHGPKWDCDILAERFHRLLKMYGDPIAIVEANNSGMEVLRLLNQSGATLWKRDKTAAATPGKKLEVVGFMTTSTSKNHWVDSVARYVREQTLECLYEAVVTQFSTFILTDDGKGQAQDGCHDDWVTAVGLALFALPSAMTYRPVWFIENQRNAAPPFEGYGWSQARGSERVRGGAMS